MSEENISYFTSFHSSNGYLIVTNEKSYFLTDSRYIEAAQNKIKTVDQINLLKTMKDDLYNHSLIDTTQNKFLLFLADIRNKCDHNKKTDPTAAEVTDLIEGTEKVIKTY